MLATWVIREDGWQDRILPTKGWQRPSDPKYDFLFTPIAKLASIVTVEAVSADVTSELEKNIESHYQDAHALEMEGFRSEEHTSELQSLMRISYAVFCLKKKNE